MASKIPNENNKRKGHSSSRSAQTFNFKGIKDLPLEFSISCLCLDTERKHQVINKNIMNNIDLKSLLRLYLARKEYANKILNRFNSRIRENTVLISSKNKTNNNEKSLSLHRAHEKNHSLCDSFSDYSFEGHNNSKIQSLDLSKICSINSSESNQSNFFNFSDYIYNRPYNTGLSTLYKKILPISENNSSEEENSFQEEYQQKNEIIYSNSMYKGNSNKGKPHGFGKEIWKDGSYYEGMYRNGLKTGRGKFFWADGNEFEGYFINNEMQGFGKFNWKNGDFYEGMWKNSKMHGEGKFTWKNGDKYIGAYNQGIKHGYGIFIWNDGRINKGQWINGNISSLNIR